MNSIFISLKHLYHPSYANCKSLNHTITQETNKILFFTITLIKVCLRIEVMKVSKSLTREGFIRDCFMFDYRKPMTPGYYTLPF